MGLEILRVDFDAQYMPVHGRSAQNDGNRELVRDDGRYTERRVPYWTTAGMRNVVFRIQAVSCTTTVVLSGLLFAPLNWGWSASRTTERVKSGGTSPFLTKLYPENVSTAIVRGLNALPSVAIESRTL